MNRVVFGHQHGTITMKNAIAFREAFYAKYPALISGTKDVVYDPYEMDRDYQALFTKHFGETTDEWFIGESIPMEDISSEVENAVKNYAAAYTRAILTPAVLKQITHVERECNYTDLTLPNKTLPEPFASWAFPEHGVSLLMIAVIREFNRLGGKAEISLRNASNRVNQLLTATSELGVSLAQQDYFGRTALMYVFIGHKMIGMDLLPGRQFLFDLLRYNGADLLLKDKAGHSALFYAWIETKDSYYQYELFEHVFKTYVKLYVEDTKALDVKLDPILAEWKKGYQADKLKMQSTVDGVIKDLETQGAASYFITKLLNNKAGEKRTHSEAFFQSDAADEPGKGRRFN